MEAQLKKTVENLTRQVAENPGTARAASLVRTRLVERLTCEAQARELPPLLIDEPPLMGGDDAGPSPVELVLMALGACQEIMYASMAALWGLELTKVEVRVEGHLDRRGFLGLKDDVRPGFDKVKFDTRLESPGDPAKLAELAAFVERHCPVLDIVRQPVPVEGRVRINGKRVKV
ncbi:MAG: OsmC family protein [Deltaproteobacteria bacterium]|nr:OsmC family protein [Deltaproteobacteria bacterium]